MSSWLSSFFTAEYEGKALQKSGPVTKEQLLSFFANGKELFENPDFKMALAAGYQRGQNPQDLVNQAQARIWEDKVVPAVQGDYGLNSLSRVLGQYRNDQDFLKNFYEFVHLEERALDEAEMPANEFEIKYAKIAQIKTAMEAQMAEHEAAMQGMSAEERTRYMAEVYKTMVDMGLGMSGPSCSRPGACSSHGHGPSGPVLMQPAVTTAAPQPVEAPGMAAGGPAGGVGGLPLRPAVPRAAMGEEEQLAFFQSLQRGGAGAGAQ
uniref:Uncharacterized protein n=1 Tax=Chlamydomonas leiostraca TaxID=1034604 RepID=A0A7S0S649_9CHLO|mmetsp:Transcript_9919/g.24814  ORF Transcript_9919/g.24814 Transcript_9919/m.24814 type:complete len:264 (+) Transcript_9919:59-850(+)